MDRSQEVFRLRPAWIRGQVIWQSLLPHLLVLARGSQYEAAVRFEINGSVGNQDRDRRLCCAEERGFPLENVAS